MNYQLLLITIMMVLVPPVMATSLPSGCSTATIKKVNNDTWKWTCDDFAKEKPSDECFHSSTIVYNQYGIMLPMSEVSIGDTILDGDGEPTKVLGFLHRVITTTQVVVIADVKVTPNHLLYANDTTIFARDLTHDHILNAEMPYRTQVHPSRRMVSGLFIAPLTESGTMQVGLYKLKVSCFANHNYPTVAYWYTRIKHFFSPYDDSPPRFDLVLSSWITYLFGN